MISWETLIEKKGWKQPFFTIWTGQAFSLLGSSLVQFALVWWLTVKTGSATILATVTLVALLPQILLSPIAGALVDRWNRRIVMIVADSIVALATLVLVILFASGAIQVWHLYVAMLVRSAGGAFQWPALQASTSLMVPKEQLSRISGMNQTLYGAMNIISPPLGALLISALSMHEILAIDIGTAFLAVLPLLFIGIPQPVRAVIQPIGQPAKPTVWQDFKVGLRYVASWPGLLLVLGMATIINFLLNPASSLMPLLVTKYFNGTALHLGMIDSAFGIGAVAGGLLLSAWGGFKKRIFTSLAGLLGMAVGISLVGLAPANLFFMAVIGMGLGGLMNPIVNGPLMAIIQATVAPEYQGRVLSLIGSAASLMSPLSLAVAGPLADVLGIRFWYLTAGVVTFAMGAAGFFIPALINLESGRPQTSDQKELLAAQNESVTFAEVKID
jgi:DHA3 family macrolide efflux protein-like MFS transporter